MAIDKQKIKEIHGDLNGALDAVAKKHGLKRGDFGITYYDFGFKFTVDFTDKSVAGDADPTYYKNLRKFGPWYDLCTEDIGKTTVKLRDSEYLIEGMKDKNWVIGSKQVRGAKKLFKLPATEVQVALGRGREIKVKFTGLDTEDK